MKSKSRLESYILYKIGYFIVKIFNSKISYKISAVISFLHFLLNFKKRRWVIKNLSIITKEKNSFNLFFSALKTYYYFGRYIVDFMNIGRLTDVLKKRVKLVTEHLDKVLKEGKGVIALTGHIGNWELGAAYLARLGYKINVIAYPHIDPKVEKFFVDIRLKGGIKVENIGMGIKNCLKALDRNEILGILGDRLYGEKGVKINFFGKEVLFPIGVIKIAQRRKIPILPIFLIMKKDKYVYEIYPPIHLNENISINKCLEKVVKIFEDIISKYPNQWFTFYDYWG